MPAGKKKEKASGNTPELIHGVKPYKEKKGEEYMNENHQEHFKAILEGWKNELLDEISRTVHELRGEHENHPDPNDRASQETDMALELRSRDRESKLIKKINQAVDRIGSGDYGYCETCGVEIGVQRLEARPTAEMCIDCKTLAEIREKQMG